MTKIFILIFTLLLINSFLYTEEILNNPQPQSSEEKLISPFKMEEEYYIGKSVTVSLINKYGIVNDQKQNDYISSIGNTLALGSQQPSTFHGYTFIILNTDIETAFSAPDGYIMISSGLISKLQNEDELASIIASEIAHIVFNDPIFSLGPDKSRKYNNLVSSLRNSNSDEDSKNINDQIQKLFDDIVNEILLNLDRGYGKDKYLLCDTEAVNILSNCNYSPNSFVTALDKLNVSGNYMSIRPAKQDRINAVNAQITKTNTKIILNDQRTKRFLGIFKK
jgi:beta-barrel assembly-enhancing protease